jgi:hypothetical protein
MSQAGCPAWLGVDVVAVVVEDAKAPDGSAVELIDRRR